MKRLLRTVNFGGGAFELVSEPEVKKSGNLDGRNLRRYEGRLFNVNSQSSNPPTLLSSNNHSGGDAPLIPPYELRTVIMKDGWEIKDDYPW